MVKGRGEIPDFFISLFGRIYRLYYNMNGCRFYQIIIFILQYKFKKLSTKDLTNNIEYAIMVIVQEIRTK